MLDTGRLPINGYQNLGFDAQTLPLALSPPDSPALADLLRELGRGGRPFFLWHHYKHLHMPYWAGEAYRRRLGIDEAAIPAYLRESVCAQWVVPRDRYAIRPEDRDLIRRLYAAEVLEFNDFLARILAVLVGDGLLADTTLVLTADHGEEHLEHGHIGHASTAEHATLHEEVLRVPLVIIDPRIAGPRGLDARMQGMDLHSTLLGLVGLPTRPAAGAFDFSQAILRPDGPLPPDDRVFYFHGARMGFRTPPEREGQVIEAISDGRFKFIAERYDAPRYLCFDLTRDPGEQRPLGPGNGLDEGELAAWLGRLEACRNGLA